MQNRPLLPLDLLWIFQQEPSAYKHAFLPLLRRAAFHDSSGVPSSLHCQWIWFCQTTGLFLIFCWLDFNTSHCQSPLSLASFLNRTFISCSNWIGTLLLMWPSQVVAVFSVIHLYTIGPAHGLYIFSADFRSFFPLLLKTLSFTSCFIRHVNPPHSSLLQSSIATTFLTLTPLPFNPWKFFLLAYWYSL